jgi:hypothetical protein
MPQSDGISFGDGTTWHGTPFFRSCSSALITACVELKAIKDAICSHLPKAKM